jgi:hypothetical protein
MGNQPEVRRFTMIWLVGGIVTLALLAILAGKTVNDRGWGDYLRLMQKGSNCEAVITRTEPSGHCLAAYTFSVGGHDYFGAGPDCSARVGQKVIVTYLVADPSHSCLGYAGERLADEVVSFLFGGLSFPPLS